MVAPKGEFETTSEYQARAKRRGEETYALVTHPSEVRYDADSETMYATLSPSTVFAGFEPVKGFVIEAVTTRERSYAASNAFGASTMVTETLTSERGILPSRGGLLFEVTTLSFKVARSEAPRLKQRLKMLIVGTVDSKQEPPLDIRGSQGVNPTATGVAALTAISTRGEAVIITTD